MFIFSIKQLLRQPGKALLFFLLMAASTALVVTGAVLTIENNQRIDEVESTYTTIGMVEQLPVDTEARSLEDSCVGTQIWTREIYGDTILMDVLDFPGADYIVKPEQLPYFVSYLPDLSYTWGRPLPRHILEFTPLESTDGTEPVEVEVTRVLHSQLNGNGSELGDGSKDKKMQVGDRFFFTQAGNRMKVPLKAGEKYVCNLRIFGMCQAHHRQEYYTYIRPQSDQHDTQGQKVVTSVFDPVGEDLPQGLDASNARLDQVIGEDFYQPGHMGDIYLKLVEQHKMEDHLFAVMGTNSLNVLPSYHDGTISVAEGRAITQEEFDQGAMVCMLPRATAAVNQLSVGDKVKIPLLTANYGLRRALYYDYSLLNAEGEFYQPFWEGEYEIVGLYTGEQGMDDIDGKDFWEDMFVIPEKSVGAGWENNIACWNPPDRYHATFQIPNGTIAQFDEALKANVPETEELNITYDDRGYTEIVKSLRNARDMANLLLLGGVLAALTIIALLLYFFVVKEKKRTAVERSLGMTKRQCRVSLLSALMILTVLSASVGSVGGVLALDKVSEPETVAKTAEERDSLYDYDTRYSPWAVGRELAEKAEIEVEPPLYVSYAAPIALSLLVLALALLLMAGSFGTDPIYLLSTREKE